MRVDGSYYYGSTLGNRFYQSRSKDEFAGILSEKSSENAAEKARSWEEYKRENIEGYPTYGHMGNRFSNEPTGTEMQRNESFAEKNETADPLTKDVENSETKSQIMVKPDGSRVLVLTMKCGDMETTISLQLSKPTKMINDVHTEKAETEESPQKEAFYAAGEGTAKETDAKEGVSGETAVEAAGEAQSGV